MSVGLLPAILVAAALLGAGLLLRLNVGFLRRLYVPAAAVAGVLGFGVIQIGLRSGHADMAGWSAGLASQWAAWPGTLIAIVFAALLLEKPSPRAGGEALRGSVQSGILAWVIILGQIVIGLIVYVVAIRPAHPHVPPTFGQLLEVSWAGGPGSAAAMGTIYERQGFPEGRDLAFFLSTIGLIYGVVSGIFFVNLAIRRGWLASSAAELSAETSPAQSEESPPSISGAVEPLAVQVLILASAYAMGLLLQQAFVLLAKLLLAGSGTSQAFEAAANVPLFLFTLLGGWCVRRVMTLLGLSGWIRYADINRLVGVAMEFLIIAGIAAIRLDAFGQYFGPVLLLLAGAIAWSIICLLLLSRPLLPRAQWFELGLLNYGFSTANTPQGMMLLRIIDPHLRSGAAEFYALAAPLSAPFVGGGIVTFLVLPIALDQFGPMVTGSILLLAIAGFLLAGRAIATAARRTA